MFVVLIQSYITFKFFCGMFQLWAYTRMSIGRCPKPADSWKKDIQFPLFKTWQKRLEEHPALATVKEVRKQLNNLKADGFNWQPYHGYGKKFVEKVDEEVEGFWATRAQLVLHGEKCKLKAHSEEYLTRYRENTLMFIGRSAQMEHTNESQAEETAKPVEPTIPIKHAEDLVARLERSCDRAERCKLSIEKLTTSLRKKLTKFKGAFGTTFEDFSMDGCSSSHSDEEDVKKFTITFKHRKRAAVKSSGIKKSAKRSCELVDADPLQQFIAEGSGSRPHSPAAPPIEVVLGTPSVSRTSFTSPFIFSIHSNYVLCDLDKYFLKGFKEYYEERKDEFDSICSMITSLDLKKVLQEGTWMDTNVMYYYFKILRDECDTCFIVDPSVSSWWSDGSDSAVEAVFGKHEHRVWDAREARTLIFIVYHRSHFSLLVGLVDEKRWEFYNSLAGDRRSVKHASKFVAWLNERYSHFGWSDPYLWGWLVKTGIPCQENGNDCGVFALAFAKHCVHRRSINFTQEDISYFHSKIVIEIFKRSWRLNANDWD
ncbi:Ulp1 protease family, catalytic domain-containing protein [Cinnamomum micranthum f. kanehirae]|uniref:Ulp1 protease family, catalytic domain-containing protein n=1 Tax=Cinnamomum micranthum f. kanehirae TaxID=337451 RepID=A0A3S4PCG3_9MAGN|nr:Ulp1 protease family, catalytic domain-containing protein [Cinnamomum micranthum f. kanehirae]